MTNEFLPINIIFSGNPENFVEIETDDGISVDVAEWIKLPNGFWKLRISALPYMEQPELF